VRDYFKKLIPDEEELDTFARWAFGEDFLEIEGSMKFLECWNTIHGKQLILLPSGQISEDAPTMVELWRELK
jgi:hypothetical protein